jgi:hypothetical protein
MKRFNLLTHFGVPDEPDSQKYFDLNDSLVVLKKMNLQVE